VKTTRLATLAMFIVALAFAAAPAFGHHTLVAIYDTSKPFTMTGTVTMFDWRNPHVWFFMDVKSADGTVTNWGFELNGVNVLRRAGWTRDSLYYRFFKTRTHEKRLGDDFPEMVQKSVEVGLVLGEDTGHQVRRSHRGR